jgi:hypothetical protein
MAFDVLSGPIPHLDVGKKVFPSHIPIGLDSHRTNAHEHASTGLEAAEQPTGLIFGTHAGTAVDGGPKPPPSPFGEMPA